MMMIFGRIYISTVVSPKKREDAFSLMPLA